VKAETLEEYLDLYGSLLGKQASAAIDPLHVPGRDKPLDLDILRPAYPAQAHVITACVKAWRRQKPLILVGDCGVGKTLCSQAIVHAHSVGRSYRALAFVPPHLVAKWKREILETIPAANVQVLESYAAAVRLTFLRRYPPNVPTWFIVSQSVAKLGTGWRSVWREQTHAKGIPCCIRCSEPIMVKDHEQQCFVPIKVEDLQKRQLYCEACGDALWTYTAQYDRWPLAKIAHKKLRGFFDYLVIDEAHQEKGSDTAQANAAGALIAAAPKVIAMTGTLIGGMAEHLRPLLFRLAPTSLVADGYGWSDKMPFNEKYGRIEKKITTKETKGTRNSHSRGSSTRTAKYLRPGVVPTLFGDHLIGTAVFLGLEEMSDCLPPLNEQVIPVEMDGELSSQYRTIEDALTIALKPMVAKGDKRLLGKMVWALLGYPDRPYGWGEIGYYERADDSDAQIWVPVVTPKDLATDVIRPKEQALIDCVLREHSEGRQCWVFSPMSDKRDVLGRLARLLSERGLRVGVLRSNEVPTKDREAWVLRHGRQNDVILSHPQLVETGLDLFDKGGSHNFCSLIFYQTGYSLFTLWQASLRHWRLAQTKECRTFFFYYAETMQARAMALMGKKMAAAKALQGKFSAEGLAALADDGESMAMALAKSLVNKIDDLDAKRQWDKIVHSAPAPVAAPSAICAEPTAPPIVIKPMKPRPPVPSPAPAAVQLSLFEQFMGAKR